MRIARTLWMGRDAISEAEERAGRNQMLASWLAARQRTRDPGSLPTAVEASIGMTYELPWPVVLLPGGVLPAQPAYQALLAALGDDVDARAKDLEMYAGETVPPPGYSFDVEVEGIRRVADEAGFETFHLVGYSAGGAASLVFASRHPGRLRSLALLEPGWAGREGQTPEEAAVFARFRALRGLPADEVMPAFVRHQLAPGVAPPPAPPGPPPPWMPSRLAGIGWFTAGLDTVEPDFEVLREFARPVYFALGGRSNPDLYARIASRLSRIFPDFTLDVFEDRHHFDPPHRVEPIRLAAALRDLWRRAEPSVENLGLSEPS